MSSNNDSDFLIDEQTFAQGALSAVSKMMTAKMGISTEGAYQTKAITYAILELAEAVKLLTHHLEKEAKRK